MQKMHLELQMVTVEWRWPFKLVTGQDKLYCTHLKDGCTGRWLTQCVDPYHRYSNEAERANRDIYDGFNLNKPFGLHGLYENIQRCKG